MSKQTAPGIGRNRAAAVAVLAAVALVGGVGCDGTAAAPGNDPAPSGRPVHRPANFDPSLGGFVACSRTILAGTVVRVADGKPGRMVATVNVADWVKPATGPDQVSLNLVDIAKDGVYRRWAQGTRLRLAVDVDPAALPDWQLSATQLAALAKLVPRASRLHCPYGPS